MRLLPDLRFEKAFRILPRLVTWLAISSFTICTGTANGLEILYSDNFDGSSTTNLAGTTPDTTVGTNTWQGNTGFKADGSVPGVVGGIYLPFTPTAGATYTITASFTTSISSTGWMAVGFSAGSPTSTNPMNTNGRGWVLVNNDIDAIQTFIGPGTSGGASVSIIDPANQLSTITISLNATDSNVANWTYSSTVRVNTTDYSVWSNVNAGMTSAGQITALGMSAFNGTGQFTSFSVVPEPSSIVLAFLAFGLIAFRARFRPQKTLAS